MKLCTICKLSRDESKFNKNSSKPDGLSNVCRSCNKIRSKSYYRAHRRTMMKQIKARQKERSNAAYDKLIDYLVEHPCIDCGEKDVVVLEFDHLRNKKADVAFLAGQGYSWPVILAEITKCEVRCANCHRRKTFAFNGFGKSGRMANRLKRRFK